jgi:hypothetical protein
MKNKYLHFNILDTLVNFLFIYLFISPPVESGTRVSSGIKWFQPPPDRNCAESNRGFHYQILGQSPPNQLTIGSL